MGFAFQIEAVLERARLALVAIDGQIARPFFRPDEGPFAARGEARAAKPAKPGFEHRVLHLVRRLRPVTQPQKRFVTAAFDIGIQPLIGRDVRMEMLRRNCVRHLFGRGEIDVVVPDLKNRRRIAAAHAGRAQHTDLGRIVSGFQSRLELLRPGQFTRQRVADPDRDGRRRGLAFLDHVEMGIEGRDLVDLGLGQPHLLGQCRHVRRRKMSVGVLDQVQKLDQKVAPAGPVAQQSPDIRKRLILGLPALRCPPSLAGAILPDTLAAGVVVKRAHGLLPPEGALYMRVVVLGIPEPSGAGRQFQGI